MKNLAQINAQAALEAEHCEAIIEREMTPSEKLAFEIGYKAGYGAACGEAAIETKKLRDELFKL
jgi:hypothetical protein